MRGGRPRLARTHSSFLSEKAFLRAALSHRDRQQVHGDVSHGHGVQGGEAGGPGRVVVGEAQRCRAALLPPVGLQSVAVPRPPELRLSASPVRPRVASPHIWTDDAAVPQSRAPHASLATGFGRDRGLLPEPPGQLNETVIRRLSVEM